jgi:mono/diheme cytochrome c family protein
MPEEGKKGFASAVDRKAIQELNAQAGKLKPPQWPKQIFGAVNPVRAAAGKQLYGALCAKCHEPTRLEQPTPSGARLHLTMVELRKIGTDPNHAFNFYARRVHTGPLAPLLGKQTLSGAEATQFITTKIMERWDPKEASQLNVWRARLQYIARPLPGVWATAPFLHNGSVPNLYQLLSPGSERDKSFCIGTFQFDPVTVGFSTKCADHERPFETAESGNSNAGHEFRDLTPTEKYLKDEDYQHGVIGPTLSPEQRWAIIEYLKTL